MEGLLVLHSFCWSASAECGVVGWYAGAWSAMTSGDIEMTLGDLLCVLAGAWGKRCHRGACIGLVSWNPDASDCRPHDSPDRND
jgi:hypothetical protein